MFEICGKVCLDKTNFNYVRNIKILIFEKTLYHKSDNKLPNTYIHSISESFYIYTETLMT